MVKHKDPDPVSNTIQCEAKLYKAQMKRKCPISLVKFHSKRICTNCFPRDALGISLCLSTHSCGIVSKNSVYLSFNKKKAWITKQIALSSWRVSWRLNFGTELTCWLTDPESELPYRCPGNIYNLLLNQGLAKRKGPLQQPMNQVVQRLPQYSDPCDQENCSPAGFAGMVSFFWAWGFQTQ